MAESYEDDIMVAWGSSWPKDIDVPHVTVIYLGNISKATFSKYDVLDAMSVIPITGSQPVRVTGLEMFGPDGDIPVARVESPILNAYQLVLTYELSQKNIFSASEFKDYKPHITLASVDTPLPAVVELTPPRLYWGEEVL